MESVQFSIIVVSFNPGDKLKKTIDSVLCQTYQNFEIIVKDGNSTDHSLESLPTDDRIKVIRGSDDGIYDAMNRAIKEATGKWLLFLNCGDYLYQEDVLEQIAVQLQGKGIFYGHTFNRKLDAEVTMNRKLSAFSCYRHVPCHQACVYSRDLFEKRNYNLKYRIRADYEHFLWSYFEEKCEVHLLDFIIASYEGAGFSELQENMERDRVEHQEITLKYMGYPRVLFYRIILALSLVRVRRYLGNHPAFATGYNKLKKILYK